MSEFIRVPVSKKDLAKERHEEILTLSRETTELCELSNEINLLIAESTPILLDIEKNTEEALQSIETANKNVVKAVELNRKSDKKKIIIIGLLTTVGLASGGSLGALAGTYLSGKAVIGGAIGMASLGTLFGTSSVLLTK